MFTLAKQFEPLGIDDGSSTSLRAPQKSCRHIHRLPKRRVWVKHYIGGHRALTDVSPASQDVANAEAIGWAYHDEGGNVSQALVKYIEVAPSRYVCSLITRDGGRGKK